MAPRTLLFAALVISVAMGCRRDPYMRKYVESLHGEIRVLENYVYQLEHDNSVLHEELTIAKERGADAKTPTSTRPATSPRRDILPPLRSQPDGGSRSDIPSDIDLSPPEIDPGVPEIHPGTPQPPDINIPTTPPRSSSGAAPGESAGSASRSKPVDNRVAHLIINPYLTAGRDADMQPGDDGLMLVVEPRNAADQYLAKPGAVSVVVLDPQLKGDDARVARWDFTADEVRQAMRPGEQQRGVHLWLPWSDAPPRNDRLQLYVRYIDADGRKLQTDQQIFVTLPGQYSQRWTPRSPTAEGHDSAAQIARQPTLDGSANRPITVVPNDAAGPSPAPSTGNAMYR